MRVHLFQSELWLPSPPDVVFPFFADAGNLEIITPPWLEFRILTKTPIAMHEGALIDYQIKLRGVPLRWRTRINVWEPGRRFVDEQISGPYRLWIHEHTFEAQGNGTLAKDFVRYAVPFDALVHRWLVRPDVEKIFAYRSEALVRLFRGGRS